MNLTKINKKYKNCIQCELGTKYKNKFIGLYYNSKNIDTLLISDYLNSRENELINTTLDYYGIDISDIFITTPLACHITEENTLPNSPIKTCEKIKDLLYYLPNIKNVILLGNTSKKVWFGIDQEIPINEGLYRNNKILYLITKNISQLTRLDNDKKDFYNKIWRYFCIYRQY